MCSRSVFALLLAVYTVAAAALSPSAPIKRPKIIGISHLAVYTSDAVAANHFYGELVGATKLTDPENPRGVRYAFGLTPRSAGREARRVALGRSGRLGPCAGLVRCRHASPPL